ncbi:ferritin-like domain-containing protein [Acidihalobacter prosperus]
MESIPFDEIDASLISDQDFYFLLLASASFVEITTDLYTRNLIEYFHGDDPLQAWLENQWLPEEIQHGKALRRYVMTVWPSFDWETAYRHFYDDYEQYCKTELLGPTRGLEMAARCIVETGTSSLYTMLYRASPEPVLRDLARRIRTDEAYHYQYFHQAFLHYRAVESLPRRSVFKTLIRRVREIDSEDAYFAFKHAYLARYGTFDESAYRSFNREIRQLARRHYPYRMAVHMGIKPLDLPKTVNKATESILRVTAKHLLS